MIVRRLGDEDLDVFRDMRLTSLKLDPDNYASDFEVWEGYSDEIWLKFLKEPVFGAFVEAQAIGLMGLIPETKSRMNHRAGIGMVWVDPNHRGQGAADALLEACLKEARRMGAIQLELAVNAENARAVRFYERHGFEAFGRLPRGFRTSEGFVDDLMMVRKLDA